MALAALLTLRIVKTKPTIFLFIALGLTLGMMVLTRSVAMLVAIFICVAIVITSKKHLKHVVLTALIVLIILLPWVIHHSRIMGKPASIENSLWYNLYITYHPEGNGNFVSEIAIKPLFILDDAERDAYCKQFALQFIKDNPGEAIKRIITRTPAFFGPETRVFNYFYSNNFVGNIPQPWISFVYLLLIVPWFFISLFGFIGSLSIQNKCDSGILLVILALYCLPHLPITTEPRYHLAMVPLLAPMAVIGVTSLGRKWNEKNVLTRRYRYIAIGIVVFFLVIWAYQIIADLPIYIQLLSPDGNLHGISY
jgi:4-amino-4-deoxy-L-arabinose transferase-like glycosyltransferase